MKILVVEDEIRIREGICNLINKINASYEVVGQATNGREGLELARLHSPDVIITDIMMPELDGISMLKELGEISELPRTIVVSAYSEFSYAQAALRLGVSEYLIKPVTIDELTKALEHLESELSNENNVPESLGSLNNVFTGLINGNLLADEALENYVTNRYGMSHPCKLIEISAYLGYFYDENISEAKINLVQMLEAYGGIEYLMLELPREMSLLIIVYQYDNQDELERWIQNYMRSHPVTMERMCMGMIRVDGLQEIQCNYRLIHSHLDWNMVLGDDVLITFPKVTKLHASSSIYPIEIENKMKVAMCASDTAGTLNEVRRFTEYFFDGKLYSPKDIKEAYTRFIWTALAIAKDMADTEQVNRSEERRVGKEC